VTRYIKGFSRLVASTATPIATGWNDSRRVGLAPTERSRLCTRTKTLKYRPNYPERVGSIEDSRAHCQRFFPWYNSAHRHSGIALMSHQTVHYGRAAALTQQRAATLEAAFIAHPQRFKGTLPTPRKLSDAVWINPPKPTPTPAISPICSLI
jgi:hypothetical protein